MTKDFGLTAGLDQPLQAGLAKDPDWKLLMQSVDGAIASASEQGNLRPVGVLANRLKKGAALNALALARLLYEGRERARAWHMAESGYVYQMFVETGISTNTLDNYIGIWETFYAPGSVVPKSVQPRLLERPLASHVAIKRMLDECGTINSDVWAELVQAEDHKSVVNITRRIRGVQTGSERLLIVLERDTGTITAWEGASLPVVIGFLRNSAEDQKDPIRKRALEIILKGAGIVLK